MSRRRSGLLRTVPVADAHAGFAETFDLAADGLAGVDWPRLLKPPMILNPRDLTGNPGGSHLPDLDRRRHSQQDW